jgi:hypothetical protein
MIQNAFPAFSILLLLCDHVQLLVTASRPPEYILQRQESH